MMNLREGRLLMLTGGVGKAVGTGGLFSRIGAVMTGVFMLMIWMFSMPLTVWGDSAGKIEVFVSIAPQAYFVQRIGGDRVDVSVLVPPGKSPATYAPSSGQMLKLSRTSLLFTVGVPFESALIPRIRAMAPDLDIVDTTQGVPLRRFDEGEALHPNEKEGAHDTEEPHHHDDGDDKADHHDAAHHHHGNGGIDPHIWMSPRLVKIQARTMCEALSASAPEDALLFSKNLETFLKDLDDLDRKLAKVLRPLQGETLFVFHPVFGYFADAYGLKQLAVERGGKTPKGRDLVKFIQLAKEHHVRVIFVQPQFDQRVAGKIASAIQGAVVSLDPLAKDYIDNLSHMAQTIQDTLGGR